MVVDGSHDARGQSTQWWEVLLAELVGDEQNVIDRQRAGLASHRERQQVAVTAFKETVTH